MWRQTKCKNKGFIHYTTKQIIFINLVIKTFVFFQIHVMLYCINTSVHEYMFKITHTGLYIFLIHTHRCKTYTQFCIFFHQSCLHSTLILYQAMLFCQWFLSAHLFLISYPVTYKFNMYPSHLLILLSLFPVVILAVTNF